MKQIAVLYATREGQTEKIASHVAAALRKHGLAVDLMNVGEAAAVRFDRYAGAVLAASVHVGHHEKEMVRFVSAHRDELERMPAAFLSVSLSEAGAEDPHKPPEQRAECGENARKMIDAFLGETGWHPAHVKPVAGALVYTHYNPLVRFVMKRIAKSAGADTDTARDFEYTDWVDLDRFAADLAHEILVSTSAAPPAIEFRHVTVVLDEKPVLRDVSFALERGQMIVITGRSASGKSVLLHSAIGFFQPTEGEILVDGAHIERLDETALLPIRSASMGLVFQEDALFSGLSVYDNAAFRLVEHGWSEEATETAVGEILRFVELETDMRKLPEELSIGMRRRLEIARALVGWPPIMLFDEPTSGLDPLTAKRIVDLTIRARDIHGISSLYVTKELHEIPYLASHAAEAMADGTVEIRRGEPPHAPPLKVLLLDRGAVALFGSAREFEASTLPAALEMTHPVLIADARRSHLAERIR
jgi:ABC-type transporter Mla maintaining outer membrane lipid asymmetry ATPase subunit MlaF/menaquinone-dependent protoporphyrinogen IX oxidase